MPAPSPLATKHRRDLLALTALAQRDLRALWNDLDPEDIDTARDELTDLLPRLVAIYGAAAATLAADYFDDARDLAGVRGRFRAGPVAMVADGALDVLARVAVGPLFGAKPDVAAALTLAAGGLQRHVANADRETIVTASIEDRSARGWVRVGNGECDWCSQYLDGEIHSAEGYDFQAHDHCQCTAEPVF